MKSSRIQTRLTTAEVGTQIIAKTVHDQSELDWACWAYSISTMLHNSVLRLIHNLSTSGQINETAKNELEDLANGEDFHRNVRTELMMVVFPINMKESTDQVDLPVVIEQVS